MEVEASDTSSIQLEVMDTTPGAVAAEEGKAVKEVAKPDETKNGTLSNNHREEPNGENDERKAAIRLCKTGELTRQNVILVITSVKLRIICFVKTCND